MRVVVRSAPGGVGPAARSRARGVSIVTELAQSASELRIVRVEPHVDEVDALVGVVVCHGGRCPAPAGVLAAVARTNAARVLREHLLTERAVPRRGVGATPGATYPLSPPPAVGAPARALVQRPATRSRARSPGHRSPRPARLARLAPLVRGQRATCLPRRPPGVPPTGHGAWGRVGCGGVRGSRAGRAGPARGGASAPSRPRSRRRPSCSVEPRACLRRQLRRARVLHGCGSPRKSLSPVPLGAAHVAEVHQRSPADVLGADAVAVDPYADGPGSHSCEAGGVGVGCPLVGHHAAVLYRLTYGLVVVFWL